MCSLIHSRNAKAVFGIECADVGLINKLRVGHDNKGLGAAWFLEKVKIRNERSGQEWIFLSGKWFDASSGDGQIVRELTPSMEDGQASLPLVTYRVTIVTGGLPGSGTNANVKLCIYGQQGAVVSDTGDLALEEKGAFEKDKTDIFELELVDLGEITKIRVGHDGTGLGAAWFLNKIVIRNGTTGKEWYFLV